MQLKLPRPAHQFQICNSFVHFDFLQCGLPCDDRPRSHESKIRVVYSNSCPYMIKRQLNVLQDKDIASLSYFGVKTMESPVYTLHIPSSSPFSLNFKIIKNNSRTNSAPCYSRHNFPSVSKAWVLGNCMGLRQFQLLLTWMFSGVRSGKLSGGTGYLSKFSKTTPKSYQHGSGIGIFWPLKVTKEMMETISNRSMK